MKAAVFTEYGPPDVLRIEEVEKPVPGDGEILIKVKASTAAAGDCRIRRADPFAARFYMGLFRPTRVNIPGFELSGVVEKIGPNVSQFKPGDEVFAFTGFEFGANAEYRCMPENPAKIQKGIVALKPSNCSFIEAAALPVGGLTAHGFLRQAGVKEGESVLIYGASGSVGTYAVQIARHLGAAVTGVCSAKNMELVRSLGAEAVFDYTKDDLSTIGRRFDVVFDAVGKFSKKQSRPLLIQGGRFLSASGSGTIYSEDLDILKDLVENGSVVPVIDRRYTLDQIRDAHAYVDQGHKAGNVVVVIDPSP
jgi:NADPH:quinone reductase-like Zn-dependent oxidoreductase